MEQSPLLGPPFPVPSQWLAALLPCEAESGVPSLGIGADGGSIPNAGAGPSPAGPSTPGQSAVCRVPLSPLVARTAAPAPCSHGPDSASCSPLPPAPGEATQHLELPGCSPAILPGHQRAPLRPLPGLPSHFPVESGGWLRVSVPATGMTQRWVPAVFCGT